MLAQIQKAEEGYLATFERHYNHSVEEVWSMLTENEKLTKWFSELHVEDLREGGLIKFDMQDGTFEEMVITELKDRSILEYTWGDDVVRFELSVEPSGCQLMLKEKLTNITDHTPRDLAGWHVCLDVINKLLEGRTVGSRETDWKKWYEEYKKAIANVSLN